MAQQPRSISNKVVSITGAARGIGKATATALARKGARVAIGDLDGDLAAQVAEEIGAGAIGLELDVTDREAYTEFLNEVERQLGPIDVVINNAGIMPTGLFELEDDATTERHIAINLHAMMHGTREAIKRMKPHRSGHIINLSSAAGKVAGARTATYNATKFGILGFSEAVALELQGTGVEISVVIPSLCRTELVSGLKAIKGLPWIDPEDVADAIVVTLERPKFEVPVPRQMAVTMKLSQLMPFKARAAMAKLIKADSIIAEMDEAGRAAYLQRLESQHVHETHTH
jgi:NAD(P)-dependent dehydrogenase (short-subunit alcohol dehydrogenase family)